LETDTLGYPTLSPAGALALRALLAHGYRPVLATGRSTGEVRERCRAYGLPGGVAEYGSAIYHAATDRTCSLVGPAEAASLARQRGRGDARLRPSPHVAPVSGRPGRGGRRADRPRARRLRALRRARGRARPRRDPRRARLPRARPGAHGAARRARAVEGAAPM